MDREKHGKEIKKIWFNGANGDQAISASDRTKLTMSATYHGDRDEFWVLVVDDGVEIAQHNCRYVASIEWA